MSLEVATENKSSEVHDVKAVEEQISLGWDHDDL